MRDVRFKNRYNECNKIKRKFPNIGRGARRKGLNLLKCSCWNSLLMTLCQRTQVSPISSWTACSPRLPLLWRPSISSWPLGQGPPCSRVCRESSHRRSTRDWGSGIAGERKVSNMGMTCHLMTQIYPKWHAGAHILLWAESSSYPLPSCLRFNYSTRAWL